MENFDLQLFAESEENSGNDTENTLASYIADFMLHKTDAGYPSMAAVAFNPDEADSDPPTNYYSSETWTTTSADDLQLAGVHYSPENPTGKWVILVTGYGHDGGSMNALAAPYLSMGVDVLIIDPRASGNSEGEWLTMGVAESVDLAIWTQEIANRNANAQITLHGVSMGAATVMMAAALSQTTNVTAIIEDCGYANIADVLKSLLTTYGSVLGFTGDVDEFTEELFEVEVSLTGYDVSKAVPLDSIENVTVPSLFIHGTADTIIPASNATELYNASGADNKTLVTIEGAEHALSAAVDPITYFVSISDLVEQSTSEIGADINSDEDNILIRGTVYNDTITATGNNVSIDAEGGNDTVTYSENADILFNFDNYSVEGSNVILTNGTDSLTVIDAKDKTVILNGVETVISGEMSAVSIDNSENDTLLTGSVLNDTIINRGDNVTVEAASGDNSIVQIDAKNGSIVAGTGNDSITAIDSDNIYINGGEGDNYIFNGFAYYDYADKITFISKNDNPDKSTSSTIISGAGNDTISNQGTYNGSINAGDGDNVIGIYHSYENTITTGAGNDSVVVSKGSKLNISTGAGNDSIIGRLGGIEEDDWSFGANATVDAGEGDDYISPHYSDNSSIYGGAGNDTIINNGTNTTINGGDGNDYIELTNNLREETGDYESAVIEVSAGDDSIVGYSDIVSIKGEFTNSGLSGNDVLLVTSNGSLRIIDGKDKTLNINGAESIIGGESSNEIYVSNGIVYTLEDGAELTYDESGNVTGISKGTVTAELAESENSPVITLDGSTAFEFTATADSDAIKMTVGGNSISYTSGNVTYSADKISAEEGTIGLKLSKTIFESLLGELTLTVPSSGIEINYGENFEFNLTESAKITANGTIGGTVSLNGNIIYNRDANNITLAKDAAFGIDVGIGSIKVNADITALEESVLAIEGMNVVIKDGSAINISGNGNLGLNGDIALSGGDLSIQILGLLSGGGVTLSLDSGAELLFNGNTGLPIRITSSGDNPLKIQSVDGVTEFSTTDENGMNFLIGESLAFNVVGSLKFNKEGNTFTITEGTTISIAQDDKNITATATADTTFSFYKKENEIYIEFENKDANVFTIDLGGKQVEFNIVGAISYNPEERTFALIKENDSYVEINIGETTYKVSAEAGTIVATVAINSDGTMTLSYPKEENSINTITVTRGETSRTSTLAISGSIIFGFDGTISLLKDSVLTVNFSDGNVLAITANEDVTDAIKFTAEDGLIISPAATDTLKLEVIFDENTGMTFSDIEGTIYYSEATVTLADGTKLGGNVKIRGTEIPATFEVNGGTVETEFSAEDLKFAVNEGAILNVNLGTSEIEITSGAFRFMLDGSGTYISENTVINANAGTVIIEKAGTYTLNGNEMTTIEDNVKVTLSDFNTLKFESDVPIIYNGHTFEGKGTVEIIEGQIFFIMTEAGTLNLDGRIFNLTEDVPQGTTISLVEDGFQVSRVIAEDEVEKYNLAESDVGKVFSEVVQITNDDSYTIELAANGIIYIDGISNNAVVKTHATFDGEDDFNYFTISTDENGTITLGDKVYEITGDDKITFTSNYSPDGTSELKVVSGLDKGGAISGNFNNIASINNEEITINGGADNATVSAVEGAEIVSLDEGNEVTVGGNDILVEVKDKMTVNDVTYTVENDSDGVLIGDKVITGLDENASLTVSNSDNYTINTTPLEVTENDVAVGLNDSYAYISKGNQINSEQTTAEIIEALGVEEEDAVIVPEDATEEVKATLDNAEGGAAVIAATETPVTIVGGVGNDTLVNSGEDTTFDMARGGADKVVVLGGNVKLENYNPRSESGIQLTAEDIKAGVKFGEGTVELANGTVELESNFVNLYDLSGNKELIAFATNESKNIDAGILTEGISILGGGDSLTSEVEEATLKGGSGDDSIIGGKDANIEAGKGNNYIEVSDNGSSKITYGDGNDTINNFNFVGEEGSDLLDNVVIKDAAVENGNVILTTEKGSITINDAEDKNIALNKDEILKVGENVKYDGVANEYWATGENAVVTVDEDYDEEFTEIDLNEIKGDVKDVDLLNYEGETEITGNDKDNVIITSDGGSTVDGGAGNDSILGGAGADEFISDSGDDTISGFEFGTEENSDKLNAKEMAVNKVKVDGENIILVTENGSTQIENAAGQTMQFQNEHTNNEKINTQFDNTVLSVNEEANFYWAAGNSATVEVGEGLDTTTTLELDLSNADFNNAEQLSFYGDIKEIDASTFEGETNLKGNAKNNVIIASAGGSTLNGGARNDKLIGGAGADTFVYELGNGKDTISNFTFGTEENSDILDLSSVSINKAKVYGSDVVLEVDGGSVKIEGAAGKTVQLKSANTNNEIVNAQFDSGVISVNDEANFYWAAGKNATVSLENYSAEEVKIDLNNADYNNAEQLSFYGDIKEIDASGYKGYATLSGNDKNNVIKGSPNGYSVLWGGNGGNDTLIGGDNSVFDAFRYVEGNGNDVIRNAKEADAIVFVGMTLDDITKVETTDSEMKLKFKDGGNLSIETKESPGFIVDNNTSYTYTYNKTTGEFDSQGAGDGGNY